MHYSTFLRNLSGVQKASPEARSAAGCCFLTDCFSQSLGTLCAQPGHLLLPTYRQDQLVCGTQFHVVQSCIKATCRPSSLKIIFSATPKSWINLEFHSPKYTQNTTTFAHKCRSFQFSKTMWTQCNCIFFAISTSTFTYKRHTQIGIEVLYSVLLQGLPTQCREKWDFHSAQARSTNSQSSVPWNHGTEERWEGREERQAWETAEHFGKGSTLNWGQANMFCF